MCICTQISLQSHLYIHTYIYTYVHTYIHTCIHACIYHTTPDKMSDLLPFIWIDQSCALKRQLHLRHPTPRQKYRYPPTLPLSGIKVQCLRGWPIEIKPHSSSGYKNRSASWRIRAFICMLRSRRQKMAMGRGAAWG